MTLISGRDCGGCTACCVWPTINKPEMQKQSGAACRNCTQAGCGIYQTRPPVCRSYYCAWRTVDIFGEEWRPDKSGVLAYVETEGISEDFDLSTGIGLMLVGNPLKIVRQKWFQDFIVTRRDEFCAAVSVAAGSARPSGGDGFAEHRADAGGDWARSREGRVGSSVEAAARLGFPTCDHHFFGQRRQ